MTPQVQTAQVLLGSPTDKPVVQNWWEIRRARFEDLDSTNTAESGGALFGLLTQLHPYREMWT